MPLVDELRQYGGEREALRHQTLESLKAIFISIVSSRFSHLEVHTELEREALSSRFSYLDVHPEEKDVVSAGVDYISHADGAHPLTFHVGACIHPSARLRCSKNQHVSFETWTLRRIEGTTRRVKGSHLKDSSDWREHVQSVVDTLPLSRSEVVGSGSRPPLLCGQSAFPLVPYAEDCGEINFPPLMLGEHESLEVHVQFAQQIEWNRNDVCALCVWLPVGETVVECHRTGLLEQESAEEMALEEDILFMEDRCFDNESDNEELSLAAWMREGLLLDEAESRDRDLNATCEDGSTNASPPSSQPIFIPDQPSRSLSFSTQCVRSIPDRPGSPMPSADMPRCRSLTSSAQSPSPRSPTDICRFAGSFQESLLSNRLPNVPFTRFDGFSCVLSASGRGRSFPSSKLPVAVMYYHLDSKTPAPYMGIIDLGRGVRIPPKGLLQLTLTNPSKTPIKMFLVKYDVSDMPTGYKTCLRQTIREKCKPNVLHYAVQVHIQRSKPKKFWVYQSIRTVFPSRHPDDPKQLMIEYDFPNDPKYFPVRQLD